MKPEREDPRPPELEALLEAASRPGALILPAAEEQALQAFRTAHEKGVHAAPLRWRRRRDDWRPAGERRRARSLKALLAGVVAAAALGGVAVAAGEGAISSPFGGDAESKPGRNAPTVPGAGEETAGDGGGERAPQRSARPIPSASHESPAERSGTAQDTVAHCRVYLLAVERQGKAPGDAAMTRLEEAAGSREAVPAYCEQLLADERQGRTGSNPPEKSPEQPERTGKKDAPGSVGSGAAPDSETG
ncbi:hypothetical protein HRW23_20680 [Streptomyces lunaelactis]|uniref:hypothetical protein n=1 Tax=Streptomyces lunaelactis TaxID=1535768 RepID=UPI0015858D3F|nr:hypothetical protein [Streptomyces lunaelactis]NUK72661.1 hypothetical protein [Streptomyces lunaelactis]NUK79770.1 hypothetical protein [Streptomyces lunaelactis]